MLYVKVGLYVAIITIILIAFYLSKKYAKNKKIMLFVGGMLLIIPILLLVYVFIEIKTL